MNGEEIRKNKIEDERGGGPQNVWPYNHPWIRDQWHGE